MYLPSITRPIYYESILYLRRHYICNCIALQNLYIPKMIYIIFKRVKILQLLNLQLFFNIRYLSSITRSIYSESNLYLHSIRKFACSKNFVFGSHYDIYLFYEQLLFSDWYFGIEVHHRIHIPCICGDYKTKVLEVLNPSGLNYLIFHQI